MAGEAKIQCAADESDISYYSIHLKLHFEHQQVFSGFLWDLRLALLRLARDFCEPVDKTRSRDFFCRRYTMMIWSISSLTIGRFVCQTSTILGRCWKKRQKHKDPSPRGAGMIPHPLETVEKGHLGVLIFDGNPTEPPKLRNKRFFIKGSWFAHHFHCKFWPVHCQPDLFLRVALGLGFWFPSFQMSHEKNPGWLGYIGDYTTQLYRDCNKPL